MLCPLAYPTKASRFPFHGDSLVVWSFMCVALSLVVTSPTCNRISRVSESERRVKETSESVRVSTRNRVILRFSSGEHRCCLMSGRPNQSVPVLEMRSQKFYFLLTNRLSSASWNPCVHWNVPNPPRIVRRASATSRPEGRHC